MTESILKNQDFEYAKTSMKINKQVKNDRIIHDLLKELNTIRKEMKDKEYNHKWCVLSLNKHVIN